MPLSNPYALTKTNTLSWLQSIPPTRSNISSLSLSNPIQFSQPPSEIPPSSPTSLLFKFWTATPHLLYQVLVCHPSTLFLYVLRSIPRLLLWPRCFWLLASLLLVPLLEVVLIFEVSLFFYKVLALIALVIGGEECWAWRWRWWKWRGRYFAYYTMTSNFWKFRRTRANWVSLLETNRYKKCKCFPTKCCFRPFLYLVLRLSYKMLECKSEPRENQNFRLRPA